MEEDRVDEDDVQGCDAGEAPLRPTDRMQVFQLFSMGSEYFVLGASCFRRSERLELKKLKPPDTVPIFFPPPSNRMNSETGPERPAD